MGFSLKNKSNQQNFKIIVKENTLILYRLRHFLLNIIIASSTGNGFLNIMCIMDQNCNETQKFTIYTNNLNIFNTYEFEFPYSKYKCVVLLEMNKNH